MSLLDKLKETGKWSVPVFKTPNLEEQLERAKTYEPVRQILSSARSKGEYDSLEARLRQHLEGVNYQNRNLYRFAKLVDTYDKALVPIDVVADYMKIMGGVGYGLSLGKELAELPAKAVYNLYYLGRQVKDAKSAKDVAKGALGFLYNLLYEGASFFIPGSLLDLTNHYLNQAEKYTVKTAVKHFAAEVNKQEREQKAQSQTPQPLSLQKGTKKAA